MSARGSAHGASGSCESDGERRQSLRLRVSPLNVGGDAMVGEKTGDAMVGEKTGAWTGKKKAKVQSTEPRPEQVEGFDLKQVEGFDWTSADLKEEIDSFHNRDYIGPPVDRNDKFWNILDDQQIQELGERLAIAHIRAHKGAGLKEAELLSMLEKDGRFRAYNGRRMWHFDSRRCKIAGFQDYQRLVLHDYGFLEGSSYNDACSTLESDQQYVRLWEKLLDKFKWLQHVNKLTQQELEIIDRLSNYHTVKLSADYPQIYSRLFNFLCGEIQYSVTYDHLYARLYFEIWKRVAKQKMNLKDALDEVKDKAMWPVYWFDVEIELETDNFKTWVLDDIDKNLEEGEAYRLILEAVRNIYSQFPRCTYFEFPRCMTFEFAKQKLFIADKMGLIGSKPHASST